MTTDAPRAQAGACLDPAQLATYIDGLAGPAERAIVERHLAGCADCREIVAAGAAIAASVPPVVLQGTRTTWIAAGMTLAAAAALFLAVRMGPSGRDSARVGALARAVGAQRVVEPRLSGGFAYAPAPPVLRGADRPAVPPPVAIAAMNAKKEVGTRADADAEATRGVADLLLGEVDASIASLERAAAAGGRAEPYSDLAAAYVVRAARTGSQPDTQRALDNADRALTLDPRMPEALFNRALALEAADRRAEAETAWRAYLERDAGSEWAREARGHLARR